MDNKQKRKLCNLIYKTIGLLLFICNIFSIYVSANAIYTNQSINKWLDISLIIIQTVFIFVLLYNSFKINHLKNVYNICMVAYFTMLVSFIGVGVVWALSYFNQIAFNAVNILTLVLLIICAVGLAFELFLGLKLLKLFKNLTISIDSVAETPNYDDELMLKKKLDELNRKLEIKKVQEKIDSIEKELDNN